MRTIWIGLLIFFGVANAGLGAGKATHVVVLVWDGMRPDLINETNTPALYQLARRGTFFQNNHSVYFSSTEVNGTALATGDYPQHGGIIANEEFRPDINPRKPVAMEALDTIRKGDAASGGNYLRAPTAAETLQRAGLRTAIAGSKPVAMLQDRADRPANASNVVLFEGRTLPAGILDNITGALGAFPGWSDNKTNRDAWTTGALIGPLWEKDVPAFSLLWLAEPDQTQHNFSPGSPQGLAAIRSSDNNLARVVAALKEKGVFDNTDLLVVSDHGFSTLASGVDVAARLNDNGFSATREFTKSPAKGKVLVAGNGASVLLYVEGHDEKTLNRLVNFLQNEDYVGVIFTKRPEQGTFPFRDALIDSPDAPDLAFSTRWTDGKNRSSLAGEIIEDISGARYRTVTRLAVPKGGHASLSPFDLHNTLVAAGPDFRRGFVDEFPSGNVDVAPTVLHILGVKPRQPMDGRVLSEALAGGMDTAAKFPPPKTSRLEATNKLEKLVWRQYLKRTEFNGVIYLDEGNGIAAPD
jgi:arylsulfatase A-like enzyme